MTEPTVKTEEKTDWGKLFKGIGKGVLKDVRTAIAVCVGVVAAGCICSRGSTPDNSTPPQA